MIHYKRIQRFCEKIIKHYKFNSLGLRFGSVVGTSENNINNRMHIQMFKTALFTGRINVPNPQMLRPFISLENVFFFFELP